VSDDRDPSCRSPRGGKGALGPDLFSLEESSKRPTGFFEDDTWKTLGLDWRTGTAFMVNQKQKMFMVSLFRRHAERTVSDFLGNLSAGSSRGCGVGNRVFGLKYFSG